MNTNDRLNNGWLRTMQAAWRFRATTVREWFCLIQVGRFLTAAARKNLLAHLLGVLICLLGVGLSASSGCGQQAGVLMYFFTKPPKTPAAYELPKKAPTLILVDDDQSLVHPRTACEALVDELATELRHHDLVDRVTTNEELVRLRQSEPKFDRRGAREIGRLANADIVLWLNVTRFSLADDLEWSAQPAYFAVTVKVLDARAEDRDKVRLWPTEREGRPVEVKISGHEIRQCKDLREAHQLMASTLAVDIAKLFYEYTEEK